ncbi:MAG: DUF5615 family PIN-like protein [Xanthobacteraceae bacterium]
MKFLVDMPLSPALAAWLREQGHDAVHAAELGLHRAPDVEILAHAKQELRTVVTADLDYPRMLVSRFRSSHHCAAPSFANFGIEGH